MFSIIISTIHDIEALLPILRSACKEAELIIIDSRYNDKTKKCLECRQHGFKQIIYAPPKERKEKMPYDFLSANNTGLAYAEEDWCFAIGDNWELKPDFFMRLNETIEIFTELYSNRFVVRPLELEPHNNDIRWNSYVRFNQRYFFLPCSPLGKEGLRRYLPIITCGALIAHRHIWYRLNGFDERYDIGAGWYDNDLFDRFVIMRYPVIFDQKLMTYRYTHESSFSHQHRDECKKIYDETTEERNRNIYAPNHFDLETLHAEMIEKKKDYII